MEYVVERARNHGPVLAGFDFGFAYPFHDCGAYFPSHEMSPSDVRSLWALIDELAGDTADLYGATAARPPSPLAPFFNVHGNRGPWFTNRRLRKTERVCPVRPSCMFNGVGPASVGVGSLAGMRILHRLVQRRDLRVAVWPFHPIENADLVVVEIFPRLYAKASTIAREHYRSEDEYDAVISSAALRTLSRDESTWSNGDALEGWIFGV